MEERKRIISLDEKGAIVETRKYISDSGTEYTVGLPHNCFYANTEKGRKGITEREPSHISVLSFIIFHTPFRNPRFPFVAHRLPYTLLMQWVGLMNNIRSQAEEVILTELICK